MSYRIRHIGNCPSGVKGNSYPATYTFIDPDLLLGHHWDEPYAMQNRNNVLEKVTTRTMEKKYKTYYVPDACIVSEICLSFSSLMLFVYVFINIQLGRNSGCFKFYCQQND